MKFSKTIWLLGFISLFADISSELLYPVLPLYLRSAGYSMLSLGLLEGLANVIAGISKGYFGHKSDVLNDRNIFIRWGYGISALGKIIMAGTPGIERIFIARMTDRFGKGIRTAPRDALLAAEALPAERAAVFGFHRALDTLGAAIGPVLAIVWLYYFPGNYSALFSIACIPAIISFIITVFVKDHSVKTKVAANTKVGFFSYFSYWKKGTGSFRNLMIPLLLLALVNSPDVFLLMTLKEAGLDDIQMIFVYIFYNLLYALLATPAGLLADKAGKKNILMAGMIFFILTYSGMAFFNSILLFLILFASYAASMACLESVVKAVITDITPKGERGQAIGFYTSAGSISMLFAGVWTGYLWPLGGPALVFSITATGAVLSLFLLKRTVAS